MAHPRGSGAPPGWPPSRIPVTASTAGLPVVTVLDGGGSYGGSLWGASPRRPRHRWRRVPRRRAPSPRAGGRRGSAGDLPAVAHRGPRTRAQLATALRKRRIPDEVAESVLSRFAEVGLIDDAAFARAWVESRHHGRGLARQALSAELRQRGIPDGEVRSGGRPARAAGRAGHRPAAGGQAGAGQPGKADARPGPAADGHAGPQGLPGRAGRSGGAGGPGTRSGRTMRAAGRTWRGLAKTAAGDDWL